MSIEICIHLFIPQSGRKIGEGENYPPLHKAREDNTYHDPYRLVV